MKKYDICINADVLLKCPKIGIPVGASLSKVYLIVLYCIVSYRIVSYRIVSYCTVSYRIVSYRIVLYCKDKYYYEYCACITKRTNLSHIRIIISDNLQS